MLTILLQVAGMVPEDCSLSGICALLKPEPLVAPGVMYAAVGLVALGLFGYLRLRDRQTAIGDHRLDPPTDP